MFKKLRLFIKKWGKLKQFICLLVLFGIFILFLYNLFETLSSKSTDISLEKERKKSLAERSIPWNMEKLKSPPNFHWVDEQSEVRSLFYEGLPYNGKPTRAFAYYAAPHTLNGRPLLDDDKFPAIVLVHPGNHHADANWAMQWAKDGYATISMDLDGFSHDNNRTQVGCPPSFRYFDYSWNYHAVSKIILAHSLIRSFDEVDPDRTAIIGVSVGGHMACIVAGVDHRFKAAVSVYGCGYLHEIPKWHTMNQFSELSLEELTLWQSVLDPSNYLRYSEVPILFAASTNDDYYPLNTLKKTYDLVSEKLRTLCIIPNWGHSIKHATSLSSIDCYIDSFLKKSPPMPVIKKPTRINGQVRAEVISHLPLVYAKLHFSTDNCDPWKRSWKVLPAMIKGNYVISDEPPPNSSSWFFLIMDSGEAGVSSEIVFEKPLSVSAIK